MIRKTTMGLSLSLALLAGCTNPNDPGQRTLGGAAIGGAGGATIGAIAGGGRGALIGGLLGAGTGAVVGHATTPQPVYAPAPDYYREAPRGKCGYGKC